MRKHLHESTLRVLAGGIASAVTIRTYSGGCSRDITLPSTSEDRAAIMPVAYGALLGLNYGNEARSDAVAARSVLSAAEFTLAQLLPCVNTYDTLYNPLRSVLECWRFASERVPSYETAHAARLLWLRFPQWLDFIRSVTEYAQPEELLPYTDPDDARTTLDSWKACGLDGVPADDPGLLFLFWNLYVLSPVPAPEVAI